MYLRNKYPNAKLIWIIGSDHIDKLCKWKDVDNLCNIVEFACAKRPNYALEADSIPQNAKIQFINFQPLQISSTDIRQFLKQEKNLQTMLESEIISYINDNKLYR